MNSVQLLGNLARDPEVRYTKTGKAVASYTIAATNTYAVLVPKGKRWCVIAYYARRSSPTNYRYTTMRTRTGNVLTKTGGIGNERNTGAAINVLNVSWR